jgi:hypothetical protein
MLKGLSRTIGDTYGEERELSWKSGELDRQRTQVSTLEMESLNDEQSWSGVCVGPSSVCVSDRTECKLVRAQETHWMRVTRQHHGAKLRSNRHKRCRVFG